MQVRAGNGYPDRRTKPEIGQKRLRICLPGAGRVDHEALLGLEHRPLVLVPFLEPAELRGRRDLDLALLPGESVNDDGLFIDGMSAELLAAASPVEIRFSRDFADALELGVAA